MNHRRRGGGGGVGSKNRETATRPPARTHAAAIAHPLHDLGFHGVDDRDTSGSRLGRLLHQLLHLGADGGARWRSVLVALPERMWRVPRPVMRVRQALHAAKILTNSILGPAEVPRVSHDPPAWQCTTEVPSVAALVFWSREGHHGMLLDALRKGLAWRRHQRRARARGCHRVGCRGSQNVRCGLNLFL